MLRHVDETSACVWVETSGPGLVTLTAGDHEAQARTFGVHGHHYALVCVEGLTPGTKTPYTLSVDGEQVWPEPDSAYPPSLIPTLDGAKPLRLAFGSCRTSVTHDEAGNKLHGVDALRAYALRMAGITDPSAEDDPDPGDQARWPDLVLFLGDQVYADETTAEMQEFIESRRDIEEPPGTELKDWEEYAHLYKLAWSDPANRWLLSTVPSAMIFDDHDIRDDWNTSLAWKQEMEATEWWHGRIVAGLGSYWVYQHLGNMTPAERAEDENWQAIQDHGGDDEYDASDLLDAFAERADQKPETYRWSFAREFGDQARLVVVDSRAARVLEPEHRSMLDDGEMDWLDRQMRGDVDHLLIGTSLPFLLGPGLHHAEAFGEALAEGAWGRRAQKVGEGLRQGADLEHWAAFQDGFQKVSAMTLEVARGRRGHPPGTITFLSGDVHHSFVNEARPIDGGGPIHSRVIQAVCSPIRNPMPRRLRFLVAVLAYGVAGPLGRVVARSAKVPDAPFEWRFLKGPWFDNNLA
ncbi:alkaline phosphatase D family protein, partial [Nocardioides sp.]|uniref:alkaline phosphatase D family protein n=1 Tax=Nocardioides sp. TaxID=35761 RepID=UPI002D803E0C